jgi:release factor glutamine methyltransferase
MSPSTSLQATHRAAIVARLRAAGCVFAEDEADLLIESAGTPAELLSMVDRRIDGLPLEHILGWASFCGIRVTVAPGVFVPRARTELLVRRAVALALAGGHRATVVDLCCGSGAIGAAVAAAVDQIRLFAADIDPASVACARLNLEPRGAQVYQGDLFAALPDHLRHRVDVLVANVPYVPTDAISLLPPEARLYEPRRALDGGTDGLDLLRRMSAEALDWLAPQGHLLVETSERQATIATEVLARAGLTPQVLRDDDLEATVVIGSQQDSGRQSLNSRPHLS